MKKREFIKITGIVGAGIALSPIAACNSAADQKKELTLGEKPHINEFTQLDLGYDFASLEPVIDAQTMEIHYGKHHAGYIRKLNKALKETGDYKGKTLREIICSVTENQTGIRNNAGGHYNHSMFWKIMAPGGGEGPAGALADAINGSFGDFDTFKSEFFSAAKTRFGSGWAWLSVGADSKLFVSSTPNQDNPLMSFAEQKGTPILGIDVWEHAYYLNYQNRRGDYIKSFTDIINWDNVAENMWRTGGR